MSPNPYLRTFGKRWMKPLTLLILVLPGAYVGWQWTLLLTGQDNAMGFNPVEWTHHFLGDTAIRVLLASLAVSPVRDLTGWAPIVLIRRRIGLAAFFYACLHLLVYLWLDKNWSISATIADVAKRIYITFGMAALLSLIPLAITSTNGMIRRMGRANWERLHWLVYPIAIAAVLHHTYMTKGTQIGELVHWAILVVLLGWRVGKQAWMRLRPAAQA